MKRRRFAILASLTACLCLVGLGVLVIDPKAKTWNQWIENLITNSSQYPILCFGRFGGFGETESMLKARRAVEMLNTLESEPMEKRIAKCGDLFDRVMTVHKRNLHEDMRLLEEAALKGDLGIKELVALNGQRCPAPIHALCLATFATAETGRRDLVAKQFREFDEFEKEVRDEINRNKAVYSRTQYSRIEAEQHIRVCVPFYRDQVNILRLVAQKDPGLLAKVDAYLRGQGMFSNEFLVAHWNARMTVFGRLVWKPVLSKGKKTYRLYQWDSPKVFNIDAQRDVVRALRKMVLEGV